MNKYMCSDLPYPLNQVPINYLQLHFNYFNDNIKIILKRFATSNSNLKCLKHKRYLPHKKIMKI